MKHAIPLVNVALLLAVAPMGATLDAQSTQDRLPPKQTWGTVAPPREPARTPSREPDRGRDHGRDRDRHGGGLRVGGSGIGFGHHHGWLAGGGLQAVINAPLQQRLRFALNDGAYVAVFEIQPGRGARLIFPNDYLPERMLPSGWHEPPLPTGADALERGGVPPERGPRYLYLVASMEPLGLLPQHRTVQALEALVGGATFRSTTTYDVTTAIRERVLRLGHPFTWAEAMVPWRPGAPEPVIGTATVRCGNGATYSVAPGTVFECPR